MRWSVIQLSARTKVFNEKVNINLTGTLDPYAINANAVRINRYNGGIGRLTRVSASSGIQFSSDNGKNKEEKNDRLNGHYDEYMDFDVPWSISLDYTFSYSKNYSRSRSQKTFEQQYHFADGAYQRQLFPDPEMEDRLQHRL